ncbi:MAG: PAS domain S-box protein [Mycobacterium sp.]|nr:PAS domain S-box protein [Mycobacterium sp.]
MTATADNVRWFISRQCRATHGLAASGEFGTRPGRGLRSAYGGLIWAYAATVSRHRVPDDDVDPRAANQPTLALLRASTDAMLDPQVLLEASADSVGQIVDFVYREVNQATCEYLGVTREELIGRGVVETMPGLRATLLADYIRCLETGEPLILNDFSYDNEILEERRRYDLRVTRASSNFIVLTWRDVTERFQNEQRVAASEARYRRSMDSAAVGMCLVAPDGRFMDVNESLCHFFGYDADTLRARTWQELTAPDYLEADLNKVNDVLDGHLESYRMVKQYIHADGHLIWGDLSVSCIRDEHGFVENFISQIIDISAQVEADERNRLLAQQLERQNKLIAESETTYRLLIENAGDLICHTREDDTGGNRIVWISPNVETVLGAPPEHWLGRTLLDLVLLEDVQAHADRWKKVSAGGVVSQRVRMRSLDGALHWFHINVNPFHNAEGQRDGAVIAAHLVDDEVAAERAAEEARRQQAKADERFRRSMDHAAVGMCLLDTEGRVQVVNEALCEFLGYDAATLRQKTWPEVTDPQYLQENLTHLAEILAGRSDSFRMINQYVHADGHLVWGDHSVSCIRDQEGRVESFLVQVTDVSPVERQLRERLEFEGFLSEAISGGRLLTYTQPIVDARTGRVVEEELLVRMAGADGQVIEPEDFLARAKRYGAMATIDRFMAARGIELARAGRRVAVNLSADSINDTATISAIIAQLRQAGDAAVRVSFEITETTALASTGVAARFSDEMRAVGCRLALDDFGTGFGSFTELRGMTLHKLKIDQSFVTDLLHDPQDESVVRAIVGIANEFGLLTTAEGVEDVETRNRLIELGVDQLQGYLIGRPTPVVTTSGETNS